MTRPLHRRIGAVKNPWTPEKAAAQAKEWADEAARERVKAAAQDLLEALKAIVASTVHWRVGGKEMEQARAAIAKAEGKQ